MSLQTKNPPILLVLFLLVPSAFAALAPIQITNSETDCSNPTLASSIDGQTVLAYEVSGEPFLMDFVQVIRMDSYFSDYIWWTEPVVLNSGSSPKVCWSRNGFYCAFVSGPVILVYHTLPSLEWDLENYEILTPNGPVLGIDFHAVATDAAGPDVFMAVHTISDPPNGSHHIQYTSHNQLHGWSDLTLLVTESFMPANPQVTWSIGPAGPLPKIFYLSEQLGESTLKHITYTIESGWSDPVIVPGNGSTSPTSFAGEFDVITSGFLNRNILGLGAQPTCPCGSIHHQFYSPELGWSSTENLTTDHAYYNWPISPNLAFDQDGRVHAFWSQLSTASDLTPLRKTLEYWILDDGTWSDAGNFLYETSHNYESRVALAVNPTSMPVLAWAIRDTVDGSPQPSQIILAREISLGDTPPPNHRQTKFGLKAWPNPFNPTVQIAFDTQENGIVELNIFDLRGSKVASIKNMIIDDHRTVVSWNGRNDQGQSVPSGVYFARLVLGSETAIVKLVLAE